jgi:hypothetical protein
MGQPPGKSKTGKEKCIMNDNEKIMDKLEKLLRLAESPNANEAYAAAQKAQEMFIKYNIDSGLLEHHQASKRRVIKRSTGIDFTAMTNPWIINLANVIAKNHRCKAFRYQVPHARRMTVGLLGFEEDFEFCRRIFQYAYCCVIERCNKIRMQYKGQYTAKQLREAANAYGAGFVAGLHSLYQQQREEHQEWGLILVIPTEVEAVAQEMSNPKTFKTKIVQEHQAVFYHGVKDGLEFDPSTKLAQ